MCLNQAVFLLIWAHIRLGDVCFWLTEAKPRNRSGRLWTWSYPFGSVPSIRKKSPTLWNLIFSENTGSQKRSFSAFVSLIKKWKNCKRDLHLSKRYDTGNNIYAKSHWVFSEVIKISTRGLILVLAHFFQSESTKLLKKNSTLYLGRVLSTGQSFPFAKNHGLKNCSGLF